MTICFFHHWVTMYDDLTFHWNGRLDTWLQCKKCGRQKSTPSKDQGAK